MKTTSWYLAVALLGALLVGCTTTKQASGEPLDADRWRSAKSQLYHRLALQYLRAGDHQRARQLLEQAVQFDVHDAGSLELLTRLAYGEGDLASAAIAARRLLERQPNSVAAMCTIGAIAEAEGASEDAEKWYRKAMDASRADPRPWIDLHRLFLNVENEDEAAVVRAELIAAFPSRIEVWLDHGAFLASEGRWSDAARSYRRVLDIHPRNAEAASRYAFSALVDRQYGDVLDLGKNMAPHARLGNAGLAMALAAARVEGGDYDAALQELDLLDESAAEHAGVLVFRGELLLRTGRVEEARVMFEAAVARDATLARAHAGLGRIHMRQQRQHAAVRSLQKSLQFDTDNAVTHALLAAALADQNDSRTAARHLGVARRLAGAERLIARIEQMFPELRAPSAEQEGR